MANIASISMPWLGQQADMKPFSRAIGTMIAGGLNAADEDVSFKEGLTDARNNLEDPFWKLKKSAMEKNLAVLDLRLTGETLKNEGMRKTAQEQRLGFEEFRSIASRLGESPVNWADYVYPGTNAVTEKMVSERSRAAQGTLLVKAKAQTQGRFNTSLRDIYTNGSREQIQAALKIESALEAGELDQADAYGAVVGIQSQIPTAGGRTPEIIALQGYAKKYRDEGDTKSADQIDAILTERGRAKGGIPSDKTVTHQVKDPDSGVTVTRRLTESEAGKLPITDKETKEQLKEYAELKAKVGAGDMKLGPDFNPLAEDRTVQLEALRTQLRQKGVDADTGERITDGLQSSGSVATSPASGASRVFDFDSSGKLIQK